MKKKYICPEITVIDIDATETICTSGAYRVQLSQIDDVDDVEFESGSYRSTLWN